MNDVVRAKLDRIDALFPQDRLEASKARIAALTSGRLPGDRYPYILSNLGFDYYDDVMPKEERLARTLDEIIAHGCTNDDFIPHFFPGCRVATIPNMFGAKEIVQTLPGGITEYGVCEKILSVDDDPRSLPDPVVSEDSIAAQWLDMQRYVLEETEGRLPVSVIDMQGPMDVAAQLWGYENLFVDAMLGGEKADFLLNQCTSAFILLWERQQELLGDRFVGTHLWGWSWVEEGPNRGASLSMDSMAMISADFFTEHTQKHLIRISETFGGLAIHSCGDFSAVIPGINCIPGINTVNASQMSVRALLDAGIDKNLFMTLGRNYSDFEEDFRLIKEEALKVEITIWGAWPEGGRMPDQWTSGERQDFEQMEQRILDVVAL